MKVSVRRRAGNTISSGFTDDKSQQLPTLEQCDLSLCTVSWKIKESDLRNYMPSVADMVSAIGGAPASMRRSMVQPSFFPSPTLRPYPLTHSPRQSILLCDHGSGLLAVLNGRHISRNDCHPAESTISTRNQKVWFDIISARYLEVHLRELA